MPSRPRRWPALSFVLTTCLVVWFGKRLVMPHARPGIYPVDSAFGLRKWIADRLMTMSLTLTNTLYATLYTVPWLRALGRARRTAQRSLHRLAYRPRPAGARRRNLRGRPGLRRRGHLSQRLCFAGPHGHRRTGPSSATRASSAAIRTMAENCLIGVQSVAPHEPPQTGTSWLGSPAIFLPRRQSVEGFDESVTYKPSAGAGRLPAVRRVLPHRAAAGAAVPARHGS